MATPIDPGAGVDSAVTAVTSAVNDNLAPLGVAAGGLIGVGLVWRLVQKMLGRRV